MHMTAEEYRAMSLRRRQYESEMRFRERIEKGVKQRRGSKGAADDEGDAAVAAKASGVRESPYVDASTAAAGGYLYRA